MTLTQVSTWFANARRRLKKENKLDSKDDDDLCDIDVEGKLFYFCVIVNIRHRQADIINSYTLVYV